MIKIFFATFFIAELIIAIAVIVKICQLNKRVNSLNALVSSSKLKIRLCVHDLKFLIAEFRHDFNYIIALVKQKKEEYLLRAIKTTLIYACIFLLKGKYQKSIMAYQLVSEIYSGFLEVDI